MSSESPCEQNCDQDRRQFFQTLPGASYIDAEAQRTADTTLATGAAEMKWINGLSIAGSFEGEFAK